MSGHNTLPHGNTDGALTLSQLLATAVGAPIEEDTLSDLQNGPAPAAGRVAEVGQSDLYLGDGDQWVSASEVSLGSSTNPFPRLNVGNIEGVEYISEAADLPDPVNGFHPLEDTMYVFSGHVESDAGLEFQPGNTSPIMGHHREHCWFIHTGNGTAIKARDSDVLASNIGINSPGGTVFDIDGTSESEFHLDTVFVADDQQKGNIADLGTVGTFRAPELRSADMRDFDSGLTIDGTYGRFYIESTVRDVTASGVTIFDFSANMVADAIDFTNCDFSKLESDTEIIRVDTDATINDVFLYEGNSHQESTVTTDNIFSGKADPSTSPFWVSSSFPIRNSGVVGEVSLSEETTTTISTQDAWVEVTGPTTEGNETQRTSGDGTGGVTYTGRKSTNVQINISVSWYGANGDEYEFAIGKDGTPEPTSALPVQGAGQNSNNISAISGIEDLTPGDTISLMVKNVASTNDITISRYIINFIGQ